MNLTEKEKAALSKLVGKLKEKFAIREILLYGSAAKGKMDEESDIDILVILEQLDWEIEKQIIDLCFETSLECDRVISVICYSQRQLESEPMKFSTFVEEVKDSGITL